MTYQKRRFKSAKQSLADLKEQRIAWARALPIRRRRLPLGECPSCDRDGPEGPSHDASPHCESGSRPHCTCDICF
jgi:hypothetical protein